MPSGWIRSSRARKPADEDAADAGDQRGQGRRAEGDPVAAAIREVPGLQGGDARTVRAEDRGKGRQGAIGMSTRARRGGEPVGLSRRQFIPVLGTLAAGAWVRAAAAASPPTHGAPAPAATPEQIWAELMEGNGRFVAGKRAPRELPQLRSARAEGRQPPGSG